MPLVQQCEFTNAIVASPALNAETVIASLTMNGPDFTVRQILLTAVVQITIGTSGTAVKLRIRRTGLTGTDVSPAANAAYTAVAAAVDSFSLTTADAPGDGSTSIYVLTAQVTAGAAASTVSSVLLQADLVQ